MDRGRCDWYLARVCSACNDIVCGNSAQSVYYEQTWSALGIDNCLRWLKSHQIAYCFSANTYESFTPATELSHQKEEESSGVLLARTLVNSELRFIWMNVSGQEVDFITWAIQLAKMSVHQLRSTAVARVFIASKLAWLWLKEQEQVHV